MHNRTLIAALTGTAALAVAAAGWAQTPTTTPTGTTTSGSATTEDRTTGTAGSGTGNTSAATSSPADATSRTAPASGTTTATDATTAAAADRTASLADTDATFLRKAMAGGMEEVRRAQAAMQNAQRAEVRNLASMMLEDHRRANEKLSQLVRTKGWDVPSDAAPSAAESDQMRMGSGAGFDDNYIEEEIRHHRETISLFRAQSSSGSDPQLRQFAQDTLPALEHHLEMLQGSYSSK